MMTRHKHNCVFYLHFATYPSVYIRGFQSFPHSGHIWLSFTHRVLENLNIQIVYT
jgi:hypothetical protein